MLCSDRKRNLSSHLDLQKIPWFYIWKLFLFGNGSSSVSSITNGEEPRRLIVSCSMDAYASNALQFRMFFHRRERHHRSRLPFPFATKDSTWFKFAERNLQPCTICDGTISSIRHDFIKAFGVTAERPGMSGIGKVYSRRLTMQGKDQRGRKTFF